MSSKSKESRLEQKAYWENELSCRLQTLNDRGVEPAIIAKDTAVKKLRAKLRETQERLRVISNAEKKVEEMSKIKSEKLSAPKIEKARKKKGIDETATESKRQQKKKKKKEGKEGTQSDD